MITRPLIRYHGGKFRLASWILQWLPPHRIYTEVYGGAASILLRKARSHGEVYNDIDGDIVNLFRVLRQSKDAARLAQLCALTPYAREEFDMAWEHTDEPIERARRTIVRAQMGFGSAGATKSSTGLRTDTKREYLTAQTDWRRYPPVLLAIAERLQGVLIENRPALEVLRQHDDPEALHFIDPPYVHETRCRPRSGGYRFEMENDDHKILLDAIQRLEGMVVLCGYDHPIYREALVDWTMKSTSARASGGRGTVTRTECLWLNPSCTQRNGWLFAEPAGNTDQSEVVHELDSPHG